MSCYYEEFIITREYFSVYLGHCVKILRYVCMVFIFLSYIFINLFNFTGV